MAFVLLCLEVPLLKGRLSVIKVQVELESELDQLYIAVEADDNGVHLVVK